MHLVALFWHVLRPVAVTPWVGNRPRHHRPVPQTPPWTLRAPHPPKQCLHQTALPQPASDDPLHLF
jgi:hypothetical protein